MPDYKWQRIEPLSESDRNIDLAATRALYDSWRASEERLKKSSASNLRKFNERLVRRLSVETGIIERIYDLDRGTTEALVASGFVEDLVTRSSTNIEPSRLIDILRDHEAAIKLVMDCVAGSRQLTKGLIHELHSIVTRNQSTTQAVDSLGNRREIPLLRGKFKELPNNPRRPDGSVHEYSPPLQVEAEIEQLLKWLESYSEIDPLLVAAWFHHRFTQIHPYQDGNGRVARALTTLILLRARLLPLVIDRDLRSDYLEALESADRGDLTKLATMFANQERTAILQALSIDADAEIAHEKTVTSVVLESLKAKFDKRRQAKHAELRIVNDVARQLRALARRALERTYTQLGKMIAQLTKPDISIIDGGPDQNNAHYYRYDVIRSARDAGKYANLQEDHYFVKASIRSDRERLVFVVSFHHVGQELSGIMEATAFAKLESYETSDDLKSPTSDFYLCSPEPFVFTYQTREKEIANAFSAWLDTATAVAIKEFGDRL